MFVPTTIGQWEFILSPCSVKDYTSSDGMDNTDIGQHIQFIGYTPAAINEVTVDHHTELGACGDNSVRFQLLWGKTHFRFQGSEFFFRCWRFNASLLSDRSKNAFFFVLTSKGKGTCYEQNGDGSGGMTLTKEETADVLLAFKELMRLELGRIPSLWALQHRFRDSDGFLCQYIPFKVGWKTAKNSAWVRVLEGPNAGSRMVITTPNEWDEGPQIV